VRDDAVRLGLLDGRALDIRDAGSRVSALLPGFDVLALASVPRSEGMPTVILEAMACGLPVVATDVGAVRELVIDGETGLVVSPGDRDGFAAALARLADDDGLRRSMGELGRSRFEQTFRLEALADRHVHAYDLALAHRRSRSGASAT
jgi:glycosyltransferase involved in cell wall biosynthesis